MFLWMAICNLFSYQNYSAHCQLRRNINNLNFATTTKKWTLTLAKHFVAGFLYLTAKSIIFHLINHTSAQHLANPRPSPFVPLNLDCVFFPQFILHSAWNNLVSEFDNFNYKGRCFGKKICMEIPHNNPSFSYNVTKEGRHGHISSGAY